MRKLSLLAILLVFDLLLAPSLYADAATDAAMVMGQITHRDNRPAVNVIVSVGGKFSVTDMQGRYLIQDVPLDRHTLQIKEIELDVRPPCLRHDETIP